MFPFRTAMAEDRPKAGYVEVTPTAACPLFPPGLPARGYVHHCSEVLQVRRPAVLGRSPSAVQASIKCFRVAASESLALCLDARPQVPASMLHPQHGAWP